MKALVVDDDAFSLKLVSSILDRNGFSVEAILSAKLALEYLNKGGHADVIVADITMPQMDGFTFLRHLKSNRRLTRIPVILCSSLNSEASIVQSIEAGATGYVVKPVKEAVLIPRVRKAIELYLGSIVVVDDVEMMRNLLTRVLNRECYSVLSTESAAGALDLIEKNRISLVISDISMPEMDGFELLAKIKEHHPRLPVLLMSGKHEFDRGTAVAAGADGFIRKPFHNVEILTLVQSYVH
jgi:CheY-like chemotaxis protein